MSDLLTVLTLVAALGSGLAGGVFFAFSTFVMPALARLTPPQGIAAMQAINVTAINALFILALFGTGALGAGLDDAELWSRYLRGWTAGNHVRTVTGLAAAVLLMLALVAG